MKPSNLIREMVRERISFFFFFFFFLSANLGPLGFGDVVLSHIISQLRPGADLSRVTLPTFVLEPRSMLERITKCVYTPPQFRPGEGVANRMVIAAVD